MSQQSGGKPQTFRDVALDALRAENSDGAERSRFAQNERFCLFADADGVEKGVEFLLAFPDASESDPSSQLDAQISLCSNGRPILEGIWRVELTVDGRRLEPRSAWETTCVDPSKAYAFCERSIALEGGRRLTRTRRARPENLPDDALSRRRNVREKRRGCARNRPRDKRFRTYETFGAT